MQYLDSKGFKHAIKGFRFTATSIEMAMRRPEVLERVTKELYPDVAMAHRTTSSRVERAIRHAIETCDCYYGKDKPTNSEFIAHAADEIKYGQEQPPSMDVQV